MSQNFCSPVFCLCAGSGKEEWFCDPSVPLRAMSSLSDPIEKDPFISRHARRRAPDDSFLCDPFLIAPVSLLPFGVVEPFLSSNQQGCDSSLVALLFFSFELLTAFPMFSGTLPAPGARHRAVLAVSSFFALSLYLLSSRAPFA